MTGLKAAMGGAQHVVHHARMSTSRNKVFCQPDIQIKRKRDIGWFRRISISFAAFVMPFVTKNRMILRYFLQCTFVYE